MYSIRRLAKDDLKRIRVQPEQSAERSGLAMMDDADMDALCRSGRSWAMVDGCGHVVACAGVIPMWDGRAHAWALVGERPKRSHLLALTRTMLNHLRMLNAEYRRIDICVDTHWRNAHRWAKMLGFEREGTMKAYNPDGRDFDSYARIDNGRS